MLLLTRLQTLLICALIFVCVVSVQFYALNVYDHQHS